MREQQNPKILIDIEDSLEEMDLEECKDEKKKINCKPIMWGMLGIGTLYFLYIIYRTFGGYL